MAIFDSYVKLPEGNWIVVPYFSLTPEAVIFLPSLWTEGDTKGSCLEETLEMGSMPYPNIAIFYGDNDDHKTDFGVS